MDSECPANLSPICAHLRSSAVKKKSLLGLGVDLHGLMRSSAVKKSSWVGCRPSRPHALSISQGSNGAKRQSVTVMLDATRACADEPPPALALVALMRGLTIFCLLAPWYLLSQ
jgi:hypothetical protein